MPLTPAPTVAVFHGDGNITLYHPDENGVRVDVSMLMRNGPVDISLEFRSRSTTILRHSLPLSDKLAYLGLPDPYSLDSLEAAYEAAEVPTDDAPIRAGDVMIFPVPNGHSVREAGVDGGMWRADTRILSRAPREPWRDLADDLADRSALMGEGVIEAAAKALHLAGWRKAGDES